MWSLFVGWSVISFSFYIFSVYVGWDWVQSRLKDTSDGPENNKNETDADSHR